MAESTGRSFVCRLAACVVAAGTLAASCWWAAGSEDRATRQEPKGQRPTAAFLELGGSPLAALLEGRLLESPRAVWLERNAIEEIRREQKLEALMDAAAGRQRVAIGKLLKADLLVLLRHFDAPKEHVELVVCETERGLRLAVHQVVVTASVEGDVRQLTTLVEQAIAKHGQEIREICAVPPFVSNDLTYEHEHLKAAYAKLVEQTVRERPGLLTVELEEARAIAREMRLAGDEIRRPMPLYLLGEFRHEGQGEKQKATLRMRVMRGERELSTREATRLSPADVATFLQRASGELIDKTLGVRPLPPNAAFEAQQLAARAETFYLLGSWDEAAALAEASLLLDGKQARMHEVAASSLGFVARRDADYNKGADSVARGIHSYFRALEHYEAILPKANRVDQGTFWHLHIHVSSAVHWANLCNKHTSPPEVQRVAGELRQRELGTVLRLVRARCRAQTGDEDRFMAWALSARPAEEQFDILLRTVGDIQDLSLATQKICRLTLHGYAINYLDNPEGRRYLQQLMASDNEAVRWAAMELEDRLDKYLAAQPKPQPEIPRSTPLPAGPQHLRFEPFKIHDPPQPPNLPRFYPFGGWIPAGPGVDLVWGGGCVYTMREAGRLERVWKGAIVNQFGTGVSGADYDGRFAWVTTEINRGKPKLLVVDPQGERVWEIGEDDGLPVVPPETIPDGNVWPQLQAEPLEPGKVLLVSSFGRLAIGTVTFDPDKGAQVDVFFEARHPHDPTKEEPWRDPQMAFSPGYVIGFRGTDQQGRPLRKVLVGVSSQSGGDGRHSRPLVVDPDSRRVDVLPHTIAWGIEPHREAVTPDAVYRVRDYPNEYRLERVGLPDFNPETLVAGVPEGYCMKLDDRFVILGSRCWLVDPKAPPQERVRVVAARPPWKYSNYNSKGAELAGAAAEPPEELLPFEFTQICRSNHFGLLAVRYSREHAYEFFRVVLDEQ